MSKNTSSKNFVSRHRGKILGIFVGITLAGLLSMFLNRKSENDDSFDEAETEDRYFQPAV